MPLNQLQLWILPVNNFFITRLYLNPSFFRSTRNLSSPNSSVIFKCNSTDGQLEKNHTLIICSILTFFQIRRGNIKAKTSGCTSARCMATKLTSSCRWSNMAALTIGWSHISPALCAFLFPCLAIHSPLIDRYTFIILGLSNMFFSLSSMKGHSKSFPNSKLVVFQVKNTNI